ncbi:hypothetical protein FJZ31_03785 [Candidatus Poribacteria bacterium]|nr:hypothetical protein [Candidatus Poribacteria bacterium]
MEMIPQVADTMQTVLTETAHQLAEETGLCKRQRKLNGASFAQTLVGEEGEGPNKFGLPTFRENSESRKSTMTNYNSYYFL